MAAKLCKLYKTQNFAALELEPMAKRLALRALSKKLLAEINKAMQ